MPKLHTTTICLLVALAGPVFSGCAALQASLDATEGLPFSSSTAQPEPEPNKPPPPAPTAEIDGTDESNTLIDNATSADAADSDAADADGLPTFDIVEEHVTFDSLGASLHGVLTMPRADERAPERRPAVVILHRQGAVDADGTTSGTLGVDFSMDVAPYAEIADQLARHGFVVLRYHKRTCLQGAGPHCPYPRSILEPHVGNLPEALRADALAALELLRSRSEVDAARINVIGDGEGAFLALSLIEDADLRALALLSPSPLPIDELLLFQIDRSMELLGERSRQETATLDGDLLQAQLDTLRDSRRRLEKLFAALEAGEHPEDTLGLPEAAWRHQLNFDRQALQTLRHPTPPLLAIFGNQDLDLPEDTSERFAELFGEPQDRQIVVAPDTTHVLVSLGENRLAVAPEVHLALLAFLLSPPPASLPASAPQAALGQE